MSAPATSRATVVLYVLLGLLVGLAAIHLALVVTPAPALAAFSDWLLLRRTEFAFLGTAMVLSVAIGFATVLLLG